MNKILYSFIILSLLFLPLQNLNAAVISVPTDSLVKGSASTIYYYANDGKRYVFPNNKTYETWFEDFSFVTTVSDRMLSLMPLAGNITYRPGIKMVKIQTDPKAYVVGRGGVLRWVQTEELAIQLYGENWNQKIDDIPVAFFINYKIGEPITSKSDYSPAVEALETRTINEDREIEVGENPLKSDTITLAPVAITIVSVMPDEILNSVENYLTITGVKFTGGARVYVGTTRIDNVTFINRSTLKAKISPSMPPGFYDVQVINPNGTRSVLRNALEITSPPEPEEEMLALSEVFDIVAPAVVQIQTDAGEGCPCLGSGMIIDTEGYVLTNYHVIEGDEEVEVKLQDDVVVSGIVMGWSEIRDLALIKISNGDNFVTLGDYDDVREGDIAYTLGFPNGVPMTDISEGIILARGQVIEGNIYVLTNAEIQHGSSGGPLVDSQGDVIGIVRGGLTIPGTDTFYGYNFAIPIDIAESLLPDLRAGVRTLKP